MVNYSYKVVSTLFLCFLLCIGCKQKAIYDAPNNKYIISTSISTFDKQTRSEISNGISVTQFNDGDKIGIEVGSGSNTKRFIITRTNGSWTPALSIPGNTSQEIKAYYPINEDFISNGFPTQGELSIINNSINIPQNDILIAQSTLQRQNHTINLNFKHCFSLLKIVASGDGYNDNNTPTISVNAKTLWTLNNNEVDATGSSRPIKLNRINNCYYTILPVQNLNGFTISNGDKTKVSQQNINLSKGKIFTINLAISNSSNEDDPEKQIEDLKRKVSQINWANSTHWVYGCSGAIYPKDKKSMPKAKLGQIDCKPNTWYYRGDWYCPILTWSKDCGWYDCVKQGYNNEDPDENDSRQCWLCSAVNVLLWWCNHNKDYINMYYEKYNVPQDERINMEYTPDINNKTTNAIFKFLRPIFSNRGQISILGIKYFLCGSYGISAQVYRHNKVIPFKGYLSKIFNSNNLGQIYNVPPSNYSKAEFSELLKEAFVGNKAIVLDAYINGYGNHATVIWGAEFDENGEVSFIYNCDNNYNSKGVAGDNEETGFKPGNACIFRYCIGEYNNVTCIKGTPDDLDKYGYQVKRVAFIDLARNVWAKEFGVLPLKEYPSNSNNR